MTEALIIDIVMKNLWENVKIDICTSRVKYSEQKYSQVKVSMSALISSFNTFLIDNILWEEKNVDNFNIVQTADL